MCRIRRQRWDALLVNCSMWQDQLKLDEISTVRSGAEERTF